MTHLITYGKDKNTGILRNIKDVPKGLECNCVCPLCGTQLEAHKGNIRRHHFKHHSAKECKAAFESQIHILSKKIIEENKALMLPQYAGRYVSFPSRKRNFTEVIPECFQDELRPDCTCKYLDSKGNEQIIWVEILYTHEVDENKRRKILERHIACVEIDVSQLFKDSETIDEDILRDFLLNRTGNRKWINNPYSDEEIQREANEIRRQESISNFLVNNSVDESLLWKFEAITKCLFLNRYQLNPKDYMNLCYTIKLHRTDHSTLPSENQRIYVSALMLLLYQLIVTGKIRFSQGDYQINRNEIQQNLPYWIEVILRHAQQTATRSNNTSGYRRWRL
ncbi:MAG: hypothetical protein IK131_01440 [Paludibacteraceae bacterium]|nr:hypothetical protein [Paludibacteraceae bacterium]